MLTAVGLCLFFYIIFIALASKAWVASFDNLFVLVGDKTETALNRLVVGASHLPNLNQVLSNDILLQGFSSKYYKT